MNNSVIDKVYLALELVRIRWEKTSVYPENTDVLESFNYYIKELTGIENLGEIEKLKEERDQYKKMYDGLHEEFTHNVNESVRNRYDNTLLFIKEVKGDMEPYVYETLTKILK